MNIISKKNTMEKTLSEREKNRLEKERLKGLADEMARLGLDFGEYPNPSPFILKRKRQYQTPQIPKLLEIKEESKSHSLHSSPMNLSHKSFSSKNPEQEKKDIPFIKPRSRSLHRKEKLPETQKEEHNSQDEYDERTSPNDNNEGILTNKFIERRESIKIIEINEEDLNNFKLEDDNCDDDDIDTTLMSTRVISKNGKLSLYEREMKHLETKNKMLEAKRKAIRKKKQMMLKDQPDINAQSKYLVMKRGKRVPLMERACELHAQHLAKIELNEEKKKQEEEQKRQIEEEELMKERIKRQGNKIFNKDEWDSFVQRQFEWKNKVTYKKKAQLLIKESIYKKEAKKKYINPKSKNIIEKIKKDSVQQDKEVFERLYRDWEEHEERQKIRDIDSLPAFKPEINKMKVKNNNNGNRNRKQKRPTSVEIKYDPLISNYTFTNNNNNQTTIGETGYNIITPSSKIKMKDRFIGKEKKGKIRKASSVDNNYYDVEYSDYNNNNMQINSEICLQQKDNNNKSEISKRFNTRNSRNTNSSSYFMETRTFSNTNNYKNDEDESKDVEGYKEAFNKLSIEKKKKSSKSPLQKQQVKFVQIENNKSESGMSTDNYNSQHKTITTVVGVPEMFGKSESMLEGFYTKRNINGKKKEFVNMNKDMNKHMDMDNYKDFDCLYKINVRNSTTGREQEDTIIATKEYSSFFIV